MSDWQDNLIRGKVRKPPRVCIYGSHAIGKSTLSSMFPKPIFISTEDGLDALDVISFPKARKYSDIEENIRNLIREEHDFQTAVVDTVDWLVEPLITQQVEGQHDAKELSYGKGAMYIAEEFRSILQGLDVLRARRYMNIVLIAHAEIRRFENPLTEPYDQYRPKLPTRCNALLQEWLDVLAFAAFRVIIKKADVGFNNTVTRGITTGDRQLHLVESPAYLAKNRYPGGPPTINMDFKDLSKHIPIFYGGPSVEEEQPKESEPEKEKVDGTV
jgi:hypothetical protein